MVISKWWIFRRISYKRPDTPIFILKLVWLISSVFVTILLSIQQVNIPYPQQIQQRFTRKVYLKMKYSNEDKACNIPTSNRIHVTYLHYLNKNMNFIWMVITSYKPILKHHPLCWKWMIQLMKIHVCQQKHHI